MSKSRGKGKQVGKRGAGPSTAIPVSAGPSSPNDFEEVLRLIDSARSRAVAAVNTALIDLYRTIGEHISRRIAGAGWGKGTVQELAEYIRRRLPNARGFSAQNLWRIRQFYDTYRDSPKLSTLLRELPWSHNLAIMSRSKRGVARTTCCPCAVGARGFVAAFGDRL